MTNWTATLAAGFGLLLVMLNAVLIYGNQSSQMSVTQRQQLINQGADLVRIEQAMVRDATVIGGAGKDDTFLQLLARYNLKPAAAAAPEKK